MDALIDLRRFRRRIINRLPYIHEDIIEEILVRLPVKSLTRFKCVSKSWCSVIYDDKRFIKAHIKKSSANPSFSNHKVTRNLDLVKEWPLLSLLHEPSAITPAVEYESPTYVKEASDFIGCCDGLVCILICDKDFILWNPATKEFNLLPSIIPNDVQLLVYGFGYDELSEDYKVFGLLGGNNWGVVKVYSLKTDSWRIVNNIPVEIGPFVIECGKFVYGKLHWTTMTVAEPKMKWDVSFFDFESECYGSLELPNRAVGDFIPHVGAVEGSLCLVCDHVTPRYFDVWIMKE